MTPGAPSPAAAGRQLVKDGEWQVPPNERPDGWESMTVKDTHTIETKTREVTVVPSKPEPVEDAPLAIEESRAVSHIPEQTDTHRRMLMELELLGTLYSDKDGVFTEYEWATDSVWSSISCEDLAGHSMAKMLTDDCLNEWIDQHRAQVRRIGTGSEAMRDLFTAVHAIVLRSLSDPKNVQAQYREKLRPLLSEEIRNAMAKDEAAVAAQDAAAAGRQQKAAT